MSFSIADFESIVTSAAILVAGFWTYHLFIKQRLKYPRAHLTHKIQNQKLSDKYALIFVRSRIENKGSVLLSLVLSRTWIQQILPFPEEIRERVEFGESVVDEGACDIDWPILESREREWESGSCEIEPGESESFCSEFIVSSDVEAVLVYTYIKNHSKKSKEIGWSDSFLYNLKSEEIRTSIDTNV